jgi:hypothetical protein
MWCAKGKNVNDSLTWRLAVDSQDFFSSGSTSTAQASLVHFSKSFFNAKKEEGDGEREREGERVGAVVVVNIVVPSESV